MGVISRPRLYLSFQRTDTSQPLASRLAEHLADAFDVLLDREPAGSEHRPVELPEDVDAVVVIIDPRWRVRYPTRPRSLAAALDRRAAPGGRAPRRREPARA